MSFSTSQWHKRYQQQALWTQNLRKYIYDKVGIQHAHKILDIGCGTGVLENELNQLSSFDVFGLDIGSRPLQVAREHAPKSFFTVGDCLHLPYPDKEFDITLCHFLLLWIKDPLNTIREMVKVTHPKGFILSLAEPDYGGRIDFPTELSQIGSWQIDSLKQQGANPFIGRELRSFFSQAGLVNIEAGVLGGQWRGNKTDQDFDLEWEIIHSDLYLNNEFMNKAGQLKTLEIASRQAHQRILFVPTFYAFGMVQG